MARLKAALPSVRRIGAVAAGAALVLLPFHSLREWPSLLLGSGIAAFAGILGFFLSPRGPQTDLAVAFVGGIFVRMGVALVALYVCLHAIPRSFASLALSFIVAYLGLLAVEAAVLCWPEQPAPRREVER